MRTFDGVRQGAFSLIEVMAVLALTAVISALAVPNLLPGVHKAHLDGAAESVAAFIGRARTEAMLNKRCVRVWIDSTNQRRMFSETLNSYDCDITPGTFAPGFNGVGLDGVNQVWSPGASLVIESSLVEVSLAQVPLSTSACSSSTGSVLKTPAGFPCGHVIFRPNGRIHSVNPAVGNDAVFNVLHTNLGPSDTKRVLLNSNGLICVYRRGQALIPGASAGDFECPP